MLAGTSRTAGSALGSALLVFIAGALLPLIERAAVRRPRYLLHSAALLVGTLTVGMVVAQPRFPGATIASQAAALQPVVAAAQETPLPEPTPAQAGAPAPPPAPVPPRPQVHVVEAGESIRMLAARFGVSPATILAANRLPNPDLIQVGQKLVILPTNGVLHTLAKGETIRRVAERYGVETAAILKANDLGPNPDLVVEGTQIVVPGADPEAELQRLAQANEAASGQQAAAVGPAKRTIPSTRTYEVQPGDTLQSIARIFGVDVQTILSSNGIENADLIRPGVELRILPVKGIEHTVQPNETLADIAWKYQVDLGLLLDYNNLDNPDVIRPGEKLVLPGGRLRAQAPAPPAAAAAAAPAPAPGAQPAPAPRAAAPAPKPPAAPAPAPGPAPAPVATGGGAAVVANAMKFLGYRYVFGGTSPAGFDCSGFVYYVHRISGSPVGRGMWQQLNGGPRIARNQLLPGDSVFFANTYMPGLSHNGIYIGNGQFIHAADESTGVTISSLNASYWASRYVGATRLW